MANLKSRLRTAIIYTMIAGSAASGMASGVPAGFKIEGETTMGGPNTTEAKKDVYKKGWEAIYKENMAYLKKENITKSTFVSYLKEFGKGLDGDISNIRYWKLAEKLVETYNQRGTSLFTIKTDKGVVAYTVTARDYYDFAKISGMLTQKDFLSGPNGIHYSSSIPTIKDRTKKELARQEAQAVPAPVVTAPKKEAAAPIAPAPAVTETAKVEVMTKEELRYREGADYFYNQYKERFPNVSRYDYYKYLKTFGITTGKEFAASIGDESNIPKIGELASQAERAAAAPVVTAQAVPKRAAPAPVPVFKAPVTAPAELNEQAKSTLDALTTAFETEQNIIKNKKTGEAELGENGEIQYASPGNMAALQSFLQISGVNYANLTKATGRDFVREIQKNEESGGKLEEREARSYEIIATMIGAMAIYKAFERKQMGTVEDGQLSGYCKDNEYAENLGRVLSYSPLRNQAGFISDVISFIGEGNHIEKIKVGMWPFRAEKNGLTEINGEGKDNEGMYVYSIAAIDNVYLQRLIKEVFELEMGKAQARKADAEKRINEADASLKSAATTDEGKALARQKLEKANADLKTETSKINDIKLYAPSNDAMAIGTTYENYKLEDKQRMPLLYKFIESRGMDRYIKDGIRDMLMANNATTAVLLQQAIEAANPAGKFELADLAKAGNVWKNYKVLVMQYLKEMALRRAPSVNKLEYKRLTDIYERTDLMGRSVIGRIEENMGPEDASKFLIDLADPGQAKKNESYGTYMKRAIREEWTKPVELKDDKGNTIRTLPSCLAQYKSDFEKTYGRKIECKDDVLLSLVIDYRITAAELDFVINNGGDLGVLNDKLNSAKKALTVERIKKGVFSGETKDIKAIGEALHNAIDIIGFDYNTVEKMLSTIGLSGLLKSPEDQYIEEFRDDVVSWLAVIDKKRASSALTLTGMSKPGEGGLVTEGRDAFNAKITELQINVGEMAASVSVSGENLKSKNVIFQKDMTQKATAYLNLFFEKYFMAEDRRYIDITMDGLSATKSRLDDFETIIENMKPTDPYYMARHPEARKGCIKVIEFMKAGLDDISDFLAKQPVTPGETKKMDINKMRPDWQFLLKMTMYGEPVLAGPNGYSVSNKMAGPKDQGFIPAMFFLMDNAKQLDELLKMPEGDAISTTIKTDKDATTVANNLDAEIESIRAGNASFRTSGYSVLMGRGGSREETVRRILGFQDAYAYYMTKVKVIETEKGEKGRILRITKYDGTELDKFIETVFGKDVLDNINSTIKFSTDFYGKFYKPGTSDANIETLKLRQKILLVSNLVPESNFYDLSNTPKQNEQVIEKVNEKNNKIEWKVKHYDNATARFIDGYAKARTEGIPVDRAMVNRLIESIARSKWAKELKDGHYTIELFDGEIENGGHGMRSFGINVRRQRMGGSAEGAAANITIEPAATLEALLGGMDGTFRVYENDQMIVRRDDDQSIALVSKSNTAVLIIASAKVPKGGLARAGYEAPADPTIVEGNLVPEGWHEAGIQPTSALGYMYWAIGHRKIRPFVSGRTMSIYNLGANYALTQWQTPEIPTVERRNVYTITADVTPIIYAGTNINIDQHYADGTGNWVSDLIGATYTQDANGTLKAFLKNNVTGLELTAKDIRDKMTQTNVNLTQAQINWVNQLLFNTNAPADNATVNVTMGPNNTIVVHTYGSSGDITIGTINVQQLVVQKFGYPSDRARFFIGAHTQWKIGNQTIDIRGEIGKPASKFTKAEFDKWKGTILNLFLSTNVGKGWTGVSPGSTLFPPGEYSFEKYFRINLEHMQPQDLQKVIEEGFGGTLTWKYGSSVISITPEAMARQTRAGAYIGPSVAIATKQYLGHGISMNEALSVDYLAATRNLTAENIRNMQIGGTYEFGGRLGAEFKINRHVTLTFGTGYQYTKMPNEFEVSNEDVSLYEAYGSFRYRRWRVEVTETFQPDRIGNQYVLGKPGVLSTKAVVVLEIPSLTIKK